MLAEVEFDPACPNVHELLEFISCISPTGTSELSNLLMSMWLMGAGAVGGGSSLMLPAAARCRRMEIWLNNLENYAIACNCNELDC